jgi:uncharacterized membrane protein
MKGTFFFVPPSQTSRLSLRESLNVSKQFFFSPSQQPLQRLLIRPVIATVTASSVLSARASHLARLMKLIFSSGTRTSTKHTGLGAKFVNSDNYFYIFVSLDIFFYFVLLFILFLLIFFSYVFRLTDARPVMMAAGGDEQRVAFR